MELIVYVSLRYFIVHVMAKDVSKLFMTKIQIELLICRGDTYIIGLNYHGHYLYAGGLSVNNYVRENKVREVYVREYWSISQCGFFGISDLRLVDNCIKMTAYDYDVIGGNESKTVILDT